MTREKRSRNPLSRRKSVWPDSRPSRWDSACPNRSRRWDPWVPWVFSSEALLGAVVRSRSVLLSCGLPADVPTVSGLENEPRLPGTTVK